MTNSERRKKERKFKLRKRKMSAMTLAVFYFVTSIWPSQSFALTGGPSQPEVQSFEPIGTSDMVDLFSGDLTYNIPLLEVDGYPINLAYHSGVTMDQEASWVGLGWNVNVGTINRAMRGLPDDFKGDLITKEFNRKPNRTYGIGINSADTEFIGKAPPGSNSLSGSANMTFNNYTGIGFSFGLNVSFGNKGGLSGGLGINANSESGLTIQPRLSYASKNSESKKRTLSLGGSGSFNNRQGLQTLSISGGVSGTTDAKKKNGNKKKKRDGSMSYSQDFMQPTYSPIITEPIKNFTLKGTLKVAPEVIFWGHIGPKVNFSYSEQSVRKKDQSRDIKAYGYMHTEDAQGANYNADKDGLIMDLNRENDGGFSELKPNLPVTNYTYDIYSVSGQGTGGSYRPFRSSVSYVNDTKGKLFTTSGDLGVEVGAGLISKVGINGSVVLNDSKSGLWENGNKALKEIAYPTNRPYGKYEPFYMKEMGEKTVTTDKSFYNDVHKDKPAYFELNDGVKYFTSLTNKLVADDGSSKTYTDNTRDQRERRNNVFSMLSHDEVINGMGLNDLPSGTSANAKSHHISEITTLSPEGSRYVYGLPAYNEIQKDVTFSVGASLYGESGYFDNFDTQNPLACSDGIIKYSPQADNSLSNDRGDDNYFERTTTPPYAHSYMLTAIISPDYVDNDNIKGPSLGDLGTWTKFSYSTPKDFDSSQEAIYNWRVPFKEDFANYNEGMKAIPTDDKANYSYGQKELSYVDKIETKNFVAVFHKSLRDDAHGVIDEDGGLNTNNKMMQLDRISLYARPNYENSTSPTPIKEVHFVYNYSLCPGVPNNSNYVDGGDYSNASNYPNGNPAGKLTLEKVFFTYRGSKEGELSPYEFVYADRNGDGVNTDAVDANFPYNLKAYNRWGNFKPNNSTGCDINDPLSNSEFPYVEQNKSQEDQYASAWSLNNVKLPSGGEIIVEYESDDYSHVQHKDAMQMMKIIGIENEFGAREFGSDLNAFNRVDMITDGGPSESQNNSLLIELPENALSTPEPYIKGIKDLYFNVQAFYKNGGDRLEPVTGYCNIDPDGNHEILNISDGSGNTKTVLKLDLKPVSKKDNGTEDYNPIGMACLQFGRLNLSQLVWNPGNASPSDPILDVVNSLVTAFSSLYSGLKNPNQWVLDQKQGNSIITNKSWVRLNNVNGHKLGGGCRVKSIKMSDSWNSMTSEYDGNGAMDPNTGESSFEYGQEYNYNLPNGNSSGVAAYEPQLGGDENPWKQPVVYSSIKRFAPDDRFFSEEPFGESFFPTASVGYSHVTVKNLQRGEDTNGDGLITGDERSVSKHATGKVVHEFYTSKDFPTKAKHTDVDVDRDKTDPFGLLSILNISSQDFLTASQGFVVETNDMHGKPKKQSVYQEDDNNPITSVEYRYQSDPYLTNAFTLNNDVVTVNDDGSVSTNSQIGVYFDMVADFRQERSNQINPGAAFNLDVSAVLFPFTPFFIGPIPAPSFFPSYSQDFTRFRSSVVTKVVQKFGVLESTIATDLGSRVETKNLAYDAETGEVLLTETATNYEDEIYSMNYPAYWHYDQMGPAYDNIDYSRIIDVTLGRAIVSNANSYFSEGDELVLYNYSADEYVKGWITEISSNEIVILDKAGIPILDDSYRATVSRSGRRNQQMQSMASITSRSNPLASFQTNVYENVIQASAIEFSDQWRTFCDCFETENQGEPSTNPYVLGTRGNWRPKSSFLHLTDRTQENYNDNTNIREDGYFSSYRPFYKWSGGKWKIDREDWTYTAEVTEFNPYGQELENRDALGRYSSATFGFNQTLATAVAANSRYNQIGFDSFEDYPFSPCADNHFKIDQEFRDGNYITDESAHSGYHSVIVGSTPVTISKDLAFCEDTEPCSDLTLVQGGNQDFITFSPGNGTAPFTLTFNIISGSNLVEYNFSQPALIFNTSQTHNVEIVLTDAEGCILKEVYNTMP